MVTRHKAPKQCQIPNLNLARDRGPNDLDHHPKPAYDTDFIELPKNLQKQATQAHAELMADPITPRGNTIKKLKGWENVWRYRLGDYRLIYSALPESNLVQLLAIGPEAVSISASTTILTPKVRPT
jgi:mRNA-degrading endonuclease RelE of RelBE toxin-antitoxin system